MECYFNFPLCTFLEINLFFSSLNIYVFVGTVTVLVFAGSVVSVRFCTKWQAPIIFSKSPLQQVGIDFLMGLRWNIRDFVIRDALKFVKVLKKEALQISEASTDIHPNTRCRISESSSLHPYYLIPWKFVHWLSIYYLGRLRVVAKVIGSILQFLVAKAGKWRKEGRDYCSWKMAVMMISKAFLPCAVATSPNSRILIPHISP